MTGTKLNRNRYTKDNKESAQPDSEVRQPYLLMSQVDLECSIATLKAGSDYTQHCQLGGDGSFRIHQNTYELLEPFK